MATEEGKAVTENYAQGEPRVKPRNTFKAFFKYFHCSHHWVWTNAGDGRKWSQCSFCKWRMDEY